MDAAGLKSYDDDNEHVFAAEIVRVGIHSWYDYHQWHVYAYIYTTIEIDTTVSS